MDVHPTKNVSIGIDPYPVGRMTFPRYPMTYPAAAAIYIIYGVPWIPSKYPSHVSINIPAPAGSVMGMESHNPFMSMDNLPSIYPKC